MLQKKNRAELLRHSLARLSPKHGEVIDLVYFHGKSITEVAEIVGIAEATVKTRMFLRAQEVGGVHCHGLGGFHCVAAPAYRIRGSFLTTADGRRLLNAV